MTSTLPTGPGASFLGERLAEPARAAALADLGLDESSDPGMERYARRVRDQLAVPVSLVSLVESDRQVFPGMCGLPDPWATSRATPLSHSFCQHVVATGDPLIIDDAREDSLVSANLATTEIGVVAYAGMPLVDDHGNVLGSLCAIDTEPRVWSPRELALLRDVAIDCSNELRLRLSRTDADRERERRDVSDAQVQVALARSHRLLGIAEALNTCRTVDDVRYQVAGFTNSSTRLTQVVLHLAPTAAPPVETSHDQLIGTSGLTMIEDLHADSSGVTEEERERYLADGARAVGYLPLNGSAAPLGVLELVWDVPRRLEPEELAMAAALSAYTAQALERALLIEDRISVAHQLQSAMLSELPQGTGLDLAACYLPARSEEQVGGDWYDLYVAPDPEGRHGADTLLLSVGDITGHDIPAAAVMGQVRAMLRQAAWDQPYTSPSTHLHSLERACQAFGIGATGTAVLATLTPLTGDAGWTMTWTNAGHPPPLVIAPDGAVTLAAAHDLMFGHPDLLTAPRVDHSLVLAPGTTVVFYTDGVTDAVGADPEQRLDDLAGIVRDLHPAGAAATVAEFVSAFAGMTDDVVAVVVKVPAA